MTDQVNIPDKFMLTDGEKLSVGWARLEKHMRDRLEKLRVKNDAPQSESDTAVLRGQIRELKYLISLGEDKRFM